MPPAALGLVTGDAREAAGVHLEVSALLAPPCPLSVAGLRMDCWEGSLASPKTRAVWTDLPGVGIWGAGGP